MKIENTYGLRRTNPLDEQRKSLRETVKSKQQGTAVRVLRLLSLSFISRVPTIRGLLRDNRIRRAVPPCFRSVTTVFQNVTGEIKTRVER